MSINTEGLVEKRNLLNEVRKNYMTLQELRFFSIYLSKINARDISTRLVRFSLADFQKIMGFGKLNRAQLEETTNKLLSKVINIPNERGGYTGFTLFKKCHVDMDNQGSWYIEFDANDEALPLMFDFKREYFTYKLWNAIRLKSANQIRMYEILKQYERVGERELSIDDLRDLIGIKPYEYNRWDNFRREVLESCKKALEENTDISYDYRRGKTGRGGKWLTVIFTIRHNENYVDQLILEQFIGDSDENMVEEVVQEPENEPEPHFDIVNDLVYEPEEPENEPDDSIYNQDIELLMDLSDKKFSKKEIEALYCYLTDLFPATSAGSSIDMANYFIKKLRYMEVQNARHTINSPFSYMKRLLELELESRRQWNT